MTNAESDLFLSFIIHVKNKKCGHVGSTATQWRLGLLQDSDFAEDFEESGK